MATERLSSQGRWPRKDEAFTAVFGRHLHAGRQICSYHVSCTVTATYGQVTGASTQLD
jgi:hypothetical protein